MAAVETRDVQRPLGVLESSGLIRLAATHPELEYLFRHVLVQDAAYDSLLKQERRRLHLAVADALEQLYPDRRAELAAMLAYHLDAAGETDRALPLLVEAGEHALTRYANEEATSFFDRAAGLVPAGDSVELMRLRAQIALGRASSGWLSRPLSESVAIVEQALPLAEAVGEPELLARTLLWRALMLGNSFRPLGAGTELQVTVDRGLAIARALGDRNLEGNFLTVLGTSLKSHDPRRAIEVLEQAITLTSDADFIGSSLTADSLAMTYATLGDWEKADQWIAHARALAERSGDPKAVTDADISASGVELERGNLQRAIELAHDGARRAEAIGAPACSIIANWIAGTGELAAGQVDDALTSFGRSNQLSIQLDEGWFRNYTDAGISSARCVQGDLDAARAGWDRALARAAELNDPNQEADIRLGRAERLAELADADWTQILADLDRAVEIYRQLGLRPRTARALADRARALDALGRTDAAVADRSEADTIAASVSIEVGAKH
jgi:tetratricopeptide (TPR) repeat protein